MFFVNMNFGAGLRKKSRHLINYVISLFASHLILEIFWCVEVLSEKLHQHGLSPIMNNFLYNLLSEKHMNFSVSRISYMGLPQGSCLSPLLYNFYVNDIDACLESPCKLRQLADDGVVSVTGAKANDLLRPLQGTLDNLSTWAVKLGIEFSPEKTRATTSATYADGNNNRSSSVVQISRGLVRL